MKVAIAVDFLTSKNHYTKTLHSFIELYPDCEIFAMAHIPGDIDEFIEQRKITSSFLSKFIKTEDDIEKYVYLFVAAAQSVFIPCCFDKIIFVTSGFALNYKYCSDSETFYYNYNDLFNSEYINSKGILNKFFRQFIFNKAEVSSNKFAGKMIGKNTTPPFEIKDFPLFPKNIMLQFEKKYISINVQGICKKDFNKSLSLARKIEDTQIIIYGENEYLQEFDLEGIKIVNEISPINDSTSLASSKYIIDLSLKYWPSLAVIACRMNLDVIIHPNWKNNSYFKDLNNVQCSIDNIDDGHSEDKLSIKILENMPFKRIIKKELGF